MTFPICMQLLKIIHWSVKITLEKLGIRGLGHIPFCRLRRYWNGCLSLVLLTAVPVVFYAALELSFCFLDNCHENNPVVTFWCLIFPSFNRSNIAILRACLFIHTHSLAASLTGVEMVSTWLYYLSHHFLTASAKPLIRPSCVVQCSIHA